MTDPFLLPPQSVVSFSGGRTSGLMLRRVLDAFGGKLPEDRKVIFTNTGKEREETLEFVERCSQRWDVPITWLEYRWEPGRHYFVEVDFASASRNGEPFEQCIMARPHAFLPNPVMRFCTGEMKVKTMDRFVKRSLGWDAYFNAIGFRADEPKRVARMRKTGFTRIEATLWGDEKTAVRGANTPSGETPLFPLADAGLRIEDVAAFWAASDFDLNLGADEGNCDLCFLKGTAKILGVLRKRPDLAEWWIRMETLPRAIATTTERAAKFRKDRPGYAELLQIANGEQKGPGWLWADKGNVGACGEIEECRCTD